MWGEIRRGWQEAAMGVSGRGEKSLSPETQKTIITMHFGRYSINSRIPGPAIIPTRFDIYFGLDALFLLRSTI